MHPCDNPALRRFFRALLRGCSHHDATASQRLRHNRKLTLCTLHHRRHPRSADELRQTWSVLRRLRRYDPALVATMDACLAKLPPGGEPPLLVEGLAPLAPLQPPF